MKIPTLDEQFLQYLSQEQKAKIWEYYRVITNRELAPDTVINRITEIWDYAAQDPQLLTWLELVDYFYTQVDESECLTPDQRAYLSEYLAPKVGLTTIIEAADEGDFSDTTSEAVSEGCFVLLECPHSRGYTFVPADELQDPIWMERRCNQCHHKFKEHRSFHKGNLPDP